MREMRFILRSALDMPQSLLMLLHVMECMSCIRTASLDAVVLVY